MAADDPDQTTGAVRGGRAPGRHRTDRPAEPPQTPEVGFPAVHQPGLRPDRPRHARGGEPVNRRPEPRADSAYDDRYGDSGNGGDRNGTRDSAAWNREARNDNRWNDDRWNDDRWNDEAWAGDGRNNGRNDGRNNGRNDGWNDDRRGAVPARGGRRRDDAYPDAPYAGDHHGDRYAPDGYPPDPYAADPHVADPYAADPYAERPAGPAGRDRLDPGRAPRRRATGNGAPAGADDRYQAPQYEQDYSADPAAEIDGDFDDDFEADFEPGPEPSGPPPDRPARPRVQGLPHRPGRGPVDPAPPAMPNRRPGDPPGAPAELFVETTTETPALTPELLGRHDDARASAPTAAEPDDATDDPPGRPRVLGMALPFALPAWAERLLPRAQDDAAGGHGHGHGHGHGPARPAGRRVRILIAALLVPCALATLVGLVLLWPTGGPPDTARPGSQQPVRAQVTATTAADCSPGSGAGGCMALVVHMADGPRPGRDLVQVVPIEPGTPNFAVGDRVVLSWSGADADDAGSYQVVDFQRDSPLIWLAGLFAVAVLVLGRWRGLAALAALGLSFVVLLFFVVPAILAGRDPLAVAVVGACLIMFAVLYLTHGPSARTSTAVLGTLLSLALIGALGAGFSAAAQLTGLDDQTSNLIATLGTGVDARGLLLAGVVIGALGVLDDVTVTQTSAVWELRHANPGLSARRLFTAAMRIGRDHVASAVNTLVLAYAGAALPLLLLFSLSGRGFGDIVTSQDVATEIVRTLVGSIGLVASVPITTALAAAVAARETVPVTERPAPGTTLAPDTHQR